VEVEGPTAGLEGVATGVTTGVELDGPNGDSEVAEDDEEFELAAVEVEEGERAKGNFPPSSGRNQLSSNSSLAVGRNV